MSSLDELEEKVRQSGSLVERLNACRDRIGKMCSERRPPSMTIPVQWSDDDFFIDTTLKDAIAAYLPVVADLAAREAAERDEANRQLSNYTYGNRQGS